jgi:hypothetical protein
MTIIKITQRNWHLVAVERGNLWINPASIVGRDRPLLSKSHLQIQSRDESSIKFHRHVGFPQIIHNSFSYIWVRLLFSWNHRIWIPNDTNPRYSSITWDRRWFRAIFLSNILLFDGELILYDFKLIEIFARSPCVCDAKQSKKIELMQTPDHTWDRSVEAAFEWATVSCYSISIPSRTSSSRSFVPGLLPLPPRAAIRSTADDNSRVWSLSDQEVRRHESWSARIADIPRYLGLLLQYASGGQSIR